jgi:hypothetical protein
MNLRIWITIGLLFVTAVAVAVYYAVRAARSPKIEKFTVMYPSNKKLRGGSWDRSNVLTAVMPGGRLR